MMIKQKGSKHKIEGTYLLSICREDLYRNEVFRGVEGIEICISDGWESEYPKYVKTIVEKVTIDPLQTLENFLIKFCVPTFIPIGIDGDAKHLRIIVDVMYLLYETKTLEKLYADFDAFQTCIQNSLNTELTFDEVANAFDAQVIDTATGREFEVEVNHQKTKFKYEENGRISINDNTLGYNVSPKKALNAMRFTIVNFDQL